MPIRVGRILSVLVLVATNNDETTGFTRQLESDRFPTYDIKRCTIYLKRTDMGRQSFQNQNLGFVILQPECVSRHAIGFPAMRQSSALFQRERQRIQTWTCQYAPVFHPNAHEFSKQDVVYPPMQCDLYLFLHPFSVPNSRDRKSEASRCFVRYGRSTPFPSHSPIDRTQQSRRTKTRGSRSSRAAGTSGLSPHRRPVSARRRSGPRGPSPPRRRCRRAGCRAAGPWSRRRRLPPAGRPRAGTRRR
jgi:hypothetical protein